MGRRPRMKQAVAMAKDDLKKIEFLSVDSMVEVSSNDEGFKGAWYAAKIIKSIPKRKGKFLVQYQTLVCDKNPSQFLTESVHIAFIRPLPPPHEADQSYEVLDVVDAFHRDGWWKGVVNKVGVLEDEKGKCFRYTVVFENPPEKFDFCPENLRFHFDWINGRWVQPPKQKRMEGLNIDKGMAIEVNLNGENLESVWLPAIVVEEVGFNSFLVEYDNKDGQMKETVDSFRIRPPPPKLEVQNEILECVEAFHDSCWKKGIIIKTLTQGRYSVFLHSEEEEIQVRKSEIRPHLLWMNRTWTGFTEVPNGTQCEEQSACVDHIPKHSDVVVSVTSSSAAKCHKEKKSCKRTSRSKYKYSVKKSRNNLSDIQKENNPFRQNNKSEQQTVSEGTAIEMGLEQCASKETEFSLSIENADVMIKPLSIVPIAYDTTEAGAYSEAVNDDRVLPISFGSDLEGNADIAQIESDRIRQQDKEDTLSEMDLVDRSSKKAELPDSENEDATVRTLSIVAFEDHITEVGESSDQVNGDQALSICSGSERDGIIVTNSNQCSEIVLVDSEQRMIQELPFVKSSSFWSYVDSQEIFQSLPQKPHFSPLFECNELAREGLAIGHMLTFINLMKSVSNLKVTDPQKVFNTYLEALADLEKLGFDVKVVVDRINKLFSIKTSQEQLNNESKEIQSEIAQCDSEKAKLGGEINAIDKMISELSEKRAVKFSEKAVKDSKSNCLRIGADRINEKISNLMLDFGSLVASPW